MNDTLKNVLIAIGVGVIFIASMVCVILGQQHTGPVGLIVMLVGLGGLLFLLWLYNRKYR